jgi:hypothetical protein
VRTAFLFSSLLTAAAAAGVVALASCDTGGTLAVPPEASGPEASLPDVTLPTDDGGGVVDATAEAAPAIEASLSDVCGQPPYVTLGIVVVALSLADTDGAVLPGATFTSPLCPGLVKVSDDAGVIEGEISANTPFYGRLQAPNYVSELAPEEVFDASTTGNRIEMLPQILAGLVPGYQADAAAIVIAAEKTIGDAGSCSSLDGIALSVDGHPEANVTYFSAGSIPLPQLDASATTTRGFAAITGLKGISDGDFVTLTGTKPGCHVVFARGPVTGRVPLGNGFVSLMPAYLTP